MSVAVKICGLSDARSLTAAVDAGAAFVGLVFFRRSPRFVTLDTAAELARRVPRGVTAVGLFVDPTDAELDTVLRDVRLGMIQLHGRETPDRVRQVRARTGLPVMKAVGVSTARDVVGAAAFSGAADWLLFDAKPPREATRPGGNAVPFDWSLMRAFTGAVPWMLAGGLARANVAAAIKASGARAVDVSSGVETKPGLKSAAKIRAFIRAVQAVKSP
ncbi:MAG: phosphoribosylanthranilate isomerase [Rhodospirillaceae bacterium]|nr:phosphoribosylanthranilate isomerase [Rhodospirillaceae bacterium]